ncbi:MAG TPA: ATP-binding cassette domain-containing protein [Clostridiales bacterium]|nr:ATP-binding cassette domain-containing protein [Clostridiales bacterium]
MIEAIKLGKKFKDVEAVKDASFTVKKGEIVGLLGENGAGKTTTLRMLATMLRPTSGTALINGHSIIENPREVRREIGILFGGEVGLYDRLTARENIEYFARLNAMDIDDMKASIRELISKFQMEDYIDRKVGKFSRGMKQRVAIARSIVHRPSVMLFDEPTAGLDVTAAKIVHDFILECRQQNKAIIFSSHSMQEVEKLSDRIIIIHKGSIIDSGTIEYFKEKYQSDNMEDIFIRLVGDK